MKLTETETVKTTPEYGKIKWLIGIQNVVNIIALTLLTVAVLLIPVVIISFIHSCFMEHTYEVAQGYVEELHLDEESNSKFPIISYQVDGETYKYQSKLGVDTMQPGDKAEVLYKADNRNEATIRQQITLVYELIANVIGCCAGVALILFFMSAIFAAIVATVSEEAKEVKTVNI